MPKASPVVPGHLHLPPTVLVPCLVLEEGRNGDSSDLANQPNQHANLHTEEGVAHMWLASVRRHDGSLCTQKQPEIAAAQKPTMHAALHWGVWLLAHSSANHALH